MQNLKNQIVSLLVSDEFAHVRMSLEQTTYGGRRRSGGGFLGNSWGPQVRVPFQGELGVKRTGPLART